jgi:transcriptional regulator with XRE-family HTH domain
MGRLISESLQYNFAFNKDRRLSESMPNYRVDSIRKLALIAGVEHSTVGNLARGVTQNPNPRLLQAIAPHIYQLIRFETNAKYDVIQVVFDPEETYLDRWQELAQIGVNGDSFDQVVQQGTDIEDSYSLGEILASSIQQAEYYLSQASDELVKVRFLANRLAQSETSANTEFHLLLQLFMAQHKLSEADVSNWIDKPDVTPERISEIKNGGAPSELEIAAFSAIFKAYGFKPCSVKALRKIANDSQSPARGLAYPRLGSA